MDGRLREALLKENEELAKRRIEELGNGMNSNDLDEVWSLVCNSELVEVAEVLVERVLECDTIKPLLYACKVKANKVAELLIRRGANIRERDVYGYTPLLLACKNSMNEIAKALIEKGAEVNDKDRDGNVPLIYACKNNSMDEVVKALIQNGAYVNIKDEFGNMPLMYACINQCEEMAITLIKHGAEVDINFWGYSLLGYASKKGMNKLAKALIDKGVEINKKDIEGNTPLIYACQEGINEIAKILINGGADVNIMDQYGNMALVYAYANKNEEIVKMIQGKMLLDACREGQNMDAKELINEGADINIVDKDGNTPLMYACINSNEEIAKLLIEKEADVNAINKFSYTPLIYACASGNENIAKALLAKRVNLEDKLGAIPLIFASQDGMNGVVKTLIDRGVDIDVKDVDANTPLIYACIGENEETVKILIEMGANINIQNKFGNTPLMHVCQEGKYEMAKLLIDGGADINIVNKDGNTAFMYASSNGNREIVRMLKGQMLIDACSKGQSTYAKELIEQGADVNTVDKSGNTALLWAWKNGMGEVARILIDRGANINVEDKSGNSGLLYNMVSTKRIERKPRKITDIGKEWINDNEGLEKKDNQDNNDNILLKACREGNFEVARELIEKGVNCEVLCELSDTQMEEIYSGVISKYLNESISKLDSCISKLYSVSKDKDEEILKVSSKLNKILKVLDNLKEIDKAHRYDRYIKELAQQRIRFVEANQYVKEKDKGRGKDNGKEL